MEFTKLSEIFNNSDFEFRKDDYLYLHYKDSYPLTNEMDIDNFYYITELSDCTVKVLGLNRIKKEFNFSDFNDNWWFIRFPEPIKF